MNVAVQDFPTWGSREDDPRWIVLRNVARLILLVPTAWVLLFWSLVARAWIRVGEWPHGRSGSLFDGTLVHSSLDPSSLGLHTQLVWAGAVVGTYAVLVSPLVLIACNRIGPMRQPWTVRAFLVSMALVVFTISGNPGGAFDWFLD